jgi:periplasmic protein TonB
MNSSAAVPLYSASGCARTAAPAVFRRRFSNTQRPSASPGAAPRVLFASRRENQAPQIWMLGVALCFLSVGFAGVAHPVVALPVPSSRQLAELPPEVPVQDLTMADFADTPEEPDAATAVEAPAVEDTPPEPEPVLTEADVIEIPAAPEIEPALRVLEPLPVKTAPAPRQEPQSMPRPAVSRSLPRASPAPSTASPGTGSAGGTGIGGTAKTGRGGKGKFPKPPYPAFAKKAGLTGTVTLSVRVSVDGAAASVSVSGSSGSSQLDSYAASWVQSRWR